MKPINVGKKALAKRRRKAQSTVKGARGKIERATERTAADSAKAGEKARGARTRNYQSNM